MWLEWVVGAVPTVDARGSNVGDAFGLEASIFSYWFMLWFSIFFSGNLCVDVENLLMIFGQCNWFFKLCFLSIDLFEGVVAVIYEWFGWCIWLEDHEFGGDDYEDIGYLWIVISNMKFLDESDELRNVTRER